jgi:hypothetical protein
MQDLFHRLYRTKLTLLATLLTMAGLGLLFLAHWAANQPNWSWLHNFPAADLGLALFTTGLVSIAWQYFAGEVADAHTMALFRTAII